MKGGGRPGPAPSSGEKTPPGTSEIAPGEPRTFLANQGTVCRACTATFPRPQDFFTRRTPKPERAHTSLINPNGGERAKAIVSAPIPAHL